MKIAVIDDEARWRDKISSCLKTIFREKEYDVECFESGNAFIEKNNRYDVVFMDVEMEPLDGFQTTKLYKDIYPQAIVAMLTTHQELSNRGYLVDAFRYINKDRMCEEIREALSSVQKIFRNNKKIEINIVLTGRKLIEENDIVYIETNGRKLLVRTRNAAHMCADSMKDICQRLEKDGFFRCHQSYLINLDEVESFDDKDIYMKNNEKVMLSKRQRQAFKRAYFDRLLQCANR